MSNTSEVVTFLGRRGGAAGFLVPEPPPPLESVLCSRRTVLRCAAAGGVLLGSLARPGQPGARADLLTAAIFTAAVGWFVGKVLDATVGRLFEKTEVKVVPAPAPAVGAKYNFHNQYAAPVALTGAKLDCRWSKSHKTYVSVDGFLRADADRAMRGWFDYNVRELTVLKGLHDQRQLNDVLFPYDCRQVPTARGQRLLATACRKLDLDPAALRLDYERPFGNVAAAAKPDAKKFLALGVSDRNAPTKTSLLFVDEAAA